MKENKYNWIKYFSVVFLLLTLLSLSVDGAVEIFEDFEDGTDGVFPSSFTHLGDASSSSWWVEETGAINGTKSLLMDPQSDKNVWEFLYHDTTPSNDYCYYVDVKILGTFSGGGFLGRNPSGDDGYSFNLQAEPTGTDDFRSHEWSGGSINDVHSEGNGNLDMNNGDVVAVRGCFDGTVHTYNVTNGASTASGSIDDGTHASGYAGFVAYVDTDGRDFMFDNFCVYTGATTLGECFGESPSLELNTNLINNTINYALQDINFTVNGTFLSNNYDIVNISFYQQGIFNQTILDVNLSNNLYYNISLPSLYVGYYNISFNASNSELNGSSGVYIYNVDLLEPFSNRNYVNNTIYWEDIDNNINLNLSGNDTNLLYMNFTLWRYNDTGEEQLNFTEKTMGGGETFATLNISFNVNDIRNGTYRIDEFLADSHTAKEIKSYKNDKLSLGYDLSDKKVRITSPDLKEMKLNKKKDRYSFDMEFNKENPEIYIECDDIRYLPNSNYEGHLVCWDTKKWIDFEDEQQGEVTVEILSKNRAKVVPKTKGKKSFQFNSIGDLNIVSRSYFFTITRPYTIFVKDSITNTTVNNIDIDILNITDLSLIQSQSATDGNISFNLTGNYTVNISSTNYISNVTNLTFIETENKFIHLTSTNSLYLFIYDEQNKTLITDRNVTIDVINYDNISNTYTIDTGVTFQSGFAVGDYEINYKAEDYTPRSYYVTISGGDTQTLNLYLLIDTNQDNTHLYKNIEVLDDSATSLANATVKMQRYYISENSWETVEMAKTNDNGESFLFAELYDVPYRFVIDYQGATKKVTTQTKLDTRDLFFTISLIDIGLDTFYEIGNAATNIIFSNTTKVWTYNFDAGTTPLEQSRFHVFQTENSEITTICNETIVSQSGGLTCNMSLYTEIDGEFTAQGYLTTTSDSLEYLTSIETKQFVEHFQTYGLNGLLLSLMIVGTLAFIGLYNPSVSIILALFGLIITKLIGILFLSYTWLIGIIVVGIIYIMELKT